MNAYPSQFQAMTPEAQREQQELQNQHSQFEQAYDGVNRLPQPLPMTHYALRISEDDVERIARAVVRLLREARSND